MDFNIDMSQFHDSFFEEADEGIKVMESELIDLVPNGSDNEVIHTIFRAAHSIKGSASTFGFEAISKFTHSIETLLDKLRNDELVVTQEIITVLLESVDGLGNMLASEKSGETYDNDTIAELTARLDAFTSPPDQDDDSQNRQTDQSTGNDTTESGKENDNAPPPLDDRPEQEWKIAFLPDPKMFYSGNDPLRLIRELRSLGAISTEAVTDKLPDLDALDVHDCYLGWYITLRTTASREDIEDVFVWVQDECKLRIENLSRRMILTDRRATPTASGRRKTDHEQQSIRVSTEKVDKLLNLVGELVITQSILNSVCHDQGEELSERLQQSLEQLERNTRDLQEQTMSIRMLPVENAFQRLPRIVHDLSLAQGKKVSLELSGETTELDKTILEKIGDPLVHLVRNAIDHGIEPPEERLHNGKPEQGLISIRAIHKEGHVVIQVSDDGKGMDTEKILATAIDKQIVVDGESLSDGDTLNLIFEPGFSTAANVSDISGRGVGMDVVKQNINDLGGKVDISSNINKGTTFTIKLPLTLAILDGQIVKVGDQTYIIPLHSIVETIVFDPENIKTVSGKLQMYQYREQYIPVIKLAELFNIDGESPADADDSSGEPGLLVIFDEGDRNTGVLVDKVAGQQQVVIKSLKKNYSHVPGLTGATILGDGSVALILDVLSLNDAGSA